MYFICHLRHRGFLTSESLALARKAMPNVRAASVRALFPCVRRFRQH